MVSVRRSAVNTLTCGRVSFSSVGMVSFPGKWSSPR